MGAYRRGAVVAIVGPDGAGKTSVASALAARLRTAGRPVLHLHWRPGVLPGPGRVLGRPAAADRPHARPPHGRVLSKLLLTYYWTDWWAGWWTSIRRVRRAGGVVVIERGWMDTAVDPRRYRLDVSGRWVRRLARTLPDVDLTVLLDADPTVLAGRKAELPAAEIARQRAAWLSIRPAPLILDATAPPEDNALRVAEALASPGRQRRWLALPPRHPRIYLPVARAADAVAATRVHRPSAPTTRLVWSATRLVARTGALRYLPTGELPAELRPQLAGLVGPEEDIVVLRATEPQRFVVGVVAHGRLLRVAKVATSPHSAGAIDAEAETLARVAPHLAGAVRSPEVLEVRPGVMVTAAVETLPGGRPWRLPAEVAWELGRLYRRSGEGRIHGDLGPWNLLRTHSGWVLVDWEHSRTDGAPLWDVLHHLVQTAALLGRPHPETLLAGVLRGRGWIGHTIAAWWDGAGRTATDPVPLLDHYLRTSSERCDPDRADGRAGLRVRRQLLHALGV